MYKLAISKRNPNVNNTNLRSNNFVPGIIYGPKIDSTEVQLHMKELYKALDSDGELYQITTKNGDMLVKFQEIQKDPVTQKPKHFSLYTLKENQKNVITVPLTFNGEPQGVKQGGVLVSLINSIEVEALPRKMPESLSVDTTRLEIGDNLMAKDIKLPKGVSLTMDKSEVIAVCRPSTKMTDDSKQESEVVELETETTII